MTRGRGVFAAMLFAKIPESTDGVNPWKTPGVLLELSVERLRESPLDLKPNKPCLHLSMPRRSTELARDQFFHVYNRGNNKEEIFFEEKNYSFFLKLYQSFVSQNEAVLQTFCLLPNHYHFLLLILDEIAFAKAFNRFLIAYVKSVNKVYERVGHLFQGRYQAKHVENEDYLLHLSRYIHLNPLAAGLVKRAEDWKFSSYRHYLGLEKSDLVQSQFILSHFGSAEEYRAFVESYQEEEMQNIEKTLWIEKLS